MSRYVISMVARTKDLIPILIHGAYIVDAANDDEALGKGTKMAYARFPDEAFYNHHVVVCGPAIPVTLDDVKPYPEPTTVRTPDERTQTSPVPT